MTAKTNYKLIRSKRKSVSIEIKPDLTVIVRAPKYLSKREIDAFVNEKSEWIAKHIEKLKEAENTFSDIEPLSELQLRELCERAKPVFETKCRYYADILGVEYNRITVRHQKTKWGSCSSKKNLNFNCLLLLAPPEVLDAVVVHELCHLKHMNHSKSFYDEVLKVYPDYKKWNGWLKRNGAQLLKRN